MSFIAPKHKKKVSWELSEVTRTIIENYARYGETTEEDVIEQFFQKYIEADKKFLTWIFGLRYNQRILDRIFPNGLPEHVREVHVEWLKSSQSKTTSTLTKQT